MTEVANKTVWITGASSGIGEACARVFAEAGAAVVLSGRREDALRAVADSLPTASRTEVFDTTDFAALPGIVSRVMSGGAVDILINNAGISQRSLAMNTDTVVYDRIIDVDLRAPIHLTQACLPYMRERGGHIVAISSVAGRIGAPIRTAYCAAKHGLIGYMDALRAEVATPHGIQVTNVLPGSVKTEVSRNALSADGTARGASDAVIDAGRDPVDCARAILNAVETNTPELLYAEGMERQLAEMRHSDPEQLFAILGQLGAQTVADYEAGEDGRT